jgi:hypothetical protein
MAEPYRNEDRYAQKRANAIIDKRDDRNMFGMIVATPAR